MNQKLFVILEYISFENIHNENDLKLFSYIDRTTQYNKEMKLRMLEKIKYDFKGIRTIESLVKNEYSVEENKYNEKNKTGFLFKILEFIKKIFRSIIDFFKTIIDKVIGFFKGNNKNKDDDKYKKDKESFDKITNEYSKYTEELLNISVKYANKMDKYFEDSFKLLFDYCTNVIDHYTVPSAPEYKANPLVLNEFKKRFGPGIEKNGKVDIKGAINLFEINLRRNKYDKIKDIEKEAEFEKRMRMYEQKAQQQKELRKKQEESNERNTKIITEGIKENGITMKCHSYTIDLTNPLIKLFDQYKESSKRLEETINQFNKSTYSFKNSVDLIEYSISPSSNSKKLSALLHDTLRSLHDLDNFYCRGSRFDTVTIRGISEDQIVKLNSNIEEEKTQIIARYLLYTDNTNDVFIDIIERLTKGHIGVNKYASEKTDIKDIFPMDDVEKNKKLVNNLSDQILDASKTLKNTINNIENSNNKMLDDLNKIVKYVKNAYEGDYRGDSDSRHVTDETKSYAIKEAKHFTNIIEYFLYLVKYYSAMFTCGVKAYNYLSKEIISYKKIASKL